MPVAAPLEEALRDWSWLFPIDGLEIVNSTCPGDVIFIDRKGTLQILDFVAGQVRLLDLQEEQQIAAMPNPIAELETQGLKIKEGQCYALKPYAIFKEFVAENLYVSPLPEYVGFMGDFHRQIKDLPDGTAFRFKVVNARTNQ